MGNDVRVFVLKDFRYRNRAVRAGRYAAMLPVDAAASARRGEISLSPTAAAALEPPKPKEPKPKEPKAKAPRRKREYKRRDLVAEQQTTTDPSAEP